MSLTLERDPVTVAELVAAISDQRRGTVPPPKHEKAMPGGDAESDSATTAMVLGAHPGAGSSVVALALAEAAARRDAADGSAPVRLVDAAPQATSGLICAAERELGVDPSGWRIGFRGEVEIHRITAAVESSEHLPELATFESDRLVVDAGRPFSELLAAPNPIAALVHRVPLVLVCRATVPGVRRAERVVADLPGRPVVVGVGARRWPGPVRATFGPLLSAAHDAGRVALMPADVRLEINGIDADPLPKALTAAAMRLLDLIWPPALQTASTKPTKGRA